MASVATIPRKERTLRSDGHVAQLMAELDRATISDRLGRAREEAGLTQTEMAELLSVHWRTVQNYESPKENVVPFDLLDEWARITGRPKEWLLHGSEAVVAADDRLDAIEERLGRIEEQLARLLEQRMT